ncbi:MAG TPA: hypothetical protein VN441_01470 [Syntrophomonas sp.]|nr:hypothetical protein [Syntrophomonas sp.]
MKKIPTDKRELRKLVLETAAVIGVCALVCAGVTQVCFSVVANQTAVVPASYQTQALNGGSGAPVPAGYVKADYQLQTGPYSSQPDAQAISPEEAAERGAQDLWKVFGLNLQGQTIEMTYNAVTSTQPRANWTGIITIDNNLSYWFSVDAITGEVRGTHMDKYWDKGVNTGMDVSLIENHATYDALARSITAKKQLLSDKIATVEYYGQGYSSSPSGALNADIQMRVTSANGQQAQLTFSRYNQEFLGVDYDCWIQEAALIEEQLEKNLDKLTTSVTIDDQDVTNAEKAGSYLKVIEKMTP